LICLPFREPATAPETIQSFGLAVERTDFTSFSTFVVFEIRLKRKKIPAKNLPFDNPASNILTADGIFYSKIDQGSLNQTFSRNVFTRKSGTGMNRLEY